MGNAKRKTKVTPQEQYDARITEIRECRSMGAEYEVRAMLLILELEKRPSLWRQTPNTKFTAVIKEERFCTVHRWKMFKRARAAIPKKHILSLGVPAACLIAAQAKRSHVRLMRLALDFRKKHGVEPTYQYVSKLTRKRRVVGPPRKALLRYIEVLKNKIADLGGTVPDMEE